MSAVIGEFDLTNAEQGLIYGSWAERYRGPPGPPPNDVDVLVVGVSIAPMFTTRPIGLKRTLACRSNPVIRTPEQCATDADSLILQIKELTTVDVTPAGKVAS